tara:strand:+ start:1556 stop:2158 length:603 start_codon:yes stop_codon:yes gene_type:complete
MTLSQRIHGQIALVAAVVWGLGLTNWMLDSGKALVGVISMAGMAAIWIAVVLMERWRSFSRYTDAERRFFRGAVLGAGLMLTASLLVSLAETLQLADGVMIQRGLGVGTGLILMLTGNAMPKILGHRGGGDCAPARAEALKRFAGWALVIAGIVYVAAWVALPIRPAAGVSTVATVLALVLILARGGSKLFRRSAATTRG